MELRWHRVPAVLPQPTGSSGWGPGRSPGWLRWLQAQKALRLRAWWGQLGWNTQKSHCLFIFLIFLKFFPAVGASFLLLFARQSSVPGLHGGHAGWLKGSVRLSSLWQRPQCERMTAMFPDNTTAVTDVVLLSALKCMAFERKEVTL